MRKVEVYSYDIMTIERPVDNTYLISNRSGILEVLKIACTCYDG